MLTDSQLYGLRGYSFILDCTHQLLTHWSTVW